MIDPNTKTDYGKMKKLLQFDKLDGERRGIIHKIAEKQWTDAVEQINRYAAAPRVEALRQGTTLHKIIMQFKGWELARMEEM